MVNLNNYGVDLTEKVCSMGPIVGRDKEIDEIIGILCRKNKNNAALIGEPGVGKTAVVEGLAKRIAMGNVPKQLFNKKIYSIEMASVVAGTKYRGEFEERMKEILGEVKRRGDIIMFIDEMHTIMGAGAAEGAIDAANILKPAMSRGEIQVIGATTLNEYREIEKDSAMARRFRPVRVEEPNEETTMNILKKLVPGLKRHYSRGFKSDALTAAFKMSVKYLPDQFLPDKAIDLLDEGAAHAIMTHNDNVSEKDIAWAVSARTGIPVGRLTENERKRMLNLENILSEQIFGQKEAITAVAKSVRRGLSGLRDTTRPAACMLMAGPTGVGKTEMCRVLAEEIFGSRDAMIRLDMSEYMEKQSVSRLIGAAPGYIGYEDGGKLTEAVRRKPYCLVLFDELEKAHHDINNILLQIMEEGCLTDSTGRKVSFKNAIVVMTTNVGAEANYNESDGKDALYKHFAPEFMGRLDEIICFNPLTAENMENIVSKYLTQITKRAADNGIELRLSNGIPKLLVSKLSDDNGGARSIRRLVQVHVEEPLSTHLLALDYTPHVVKVSKKNGGISFATVKKNS